MTSLLAAQNNLVLRSENDALNVMSSGLPGCVFTPEELHPGFFDLQNGIAGGVFQKFINYHFRIALVIPVDHGYGERINELIRDHKDHPCIRFFTTAEDAEAWLT